METLIEGQQVGRFGRARLQIDGPPPEQLEEGREQVGNLLRMEPEKGLPTVWAAVTSRDEAIAMHACFAALADETAPAADLRVFVEQQIGRDADWAAIRDRYAKIVEAFEPGF